MQLNLIRLAPTTIYAVEHDSTTIDAVGLASTTIDAVEHDSTTIYAVELASTTIGHSRTLFDHN